MSQRVGRMKVTAATWVVKACRGRRRKEVVSTGRPKTLSGDGCCSGSHTVGRKGLIDSW